MINFFPTKTRMLPRALDVVCRRRVAAPLILGLSGLVLTRLVYPCLVRAVLCRRIRRLMHVQHCLARHAAIARALGHKYTELMDKGDARPQLAERLRALRRVQRSALVRLDATRDDIDRSLIELWQQRGGAVGEVDRSCAGGDAPQSSGSTEDHLRQELSREVAHAHRLLGTQPDDLDLMAPLSRQAMLKDEARALQCLEASDAPPQQPAALRRAIRALRSEEANVELHAELLVQTAAVAKEKGWTTTNFAYGSTPLGSWLAVFACEPVREYLAQAAAATGGAPARSVRYAVLGSSLGSLAMYGACVHRLRSRGIELLPALASRASRIAQAARVDGASFECADILACDLRHEEIVLLASQCWDEKLREAVAAKLLAELPSESLVIDYTAALGAIQATSEGRYFELACTVRAPVSWDGAHSFWVWRLQVLDGSLHS